MIAIEGDVRRAARLAGYGRAYYRDQGLDRQAGEQRSWVRLLAILDDTLGSAEQEAFMAEGAAWSEDEAVASALGKDRVPS